MAWPSLLAVTALGHQLTSSLLDQSDLSNLDSGGFLFKVNKTVHDIPNFSCFTLFLNIILRPPSSVPLPGPWLNMRGGRLQLAISHPC